MRPDSDGFRSRRNRRVTLMYRNPLQTDGLCPSPIPPAGLSRVTSGTGMHPDGDGFHSRRHGRVTLMCRNPFQTDDHSPSSIPLLWNRNGPGLTFRSVPARGIESGSVPVPFCMVSDHNHNPNPNPKSSRSRSRPSFLEPGHAALESEMEEVEHSSDAWNQEWRSSSQVRCL